MAKRKESTYERLQKGQQLNRRERRELANRLNSVDPGLVIVNRHAAGIDIGNESHYVAVPAGRDEQPVREFGSWTADLEKMAQWLKACGIETVVMQSTGVYWMAMYDLLQSRKTSFWREAQIRSQESGVGSQPSPTAKTCVFFPQPAGTSRRKFA